MSHGSEDRDLVSGRKEELLHKAYVAKKVKKHYRSIENRGSNP